MFLDSEMQVVFCLLQYYISYFGFSLWQYEFSYNMFQTLSFEPD
jgi:hypothetical protein